MKFCQLIRVVSFIRFLKNVLTRILCIIIWYNYIDDVTHVRDAVMDMMADESYHLPSETNQICLSMAK